MSESAGGRPVPVSPQPELPPVYEGRQAVKLIKSSISEWNSSERLQIRRKWPPLQLRLTEQSSCISLSGASLVYYCKQCRVSGDKDCFVCPAVRCGGLGSCLDNSVGRTGLPAVQCGGVGGAGGQVARDPTPRGGKSDTKQWSWRVVL